MNARHLGVMVTRRGIWNFKPEHALRSVLERVDYRTGFMANAVG
jgi:hypothetical protein